MCRISPPIFNLTIRLSKKKKFFKITIDKILLKTKYITRRLSRLHTLNIEKKMSAKFKY